MLLDPKTPLSALLLAEAHVRAIGYPLLSPLDFIRASLAESGVQGVEVVAAPIFTGKKVTLKELLPGLRLRSGSSEIEIVRSRPTEAEVVFKLRGKTQHMDSIKFLALVNQQGYRKVWDLPAFLKTLKTLLRPVLAAVPLMWVLRLIVNAVRKKPFKFSSLDPLQVGDRKAGSRIQL